MLLKNVFHSYEINWIIGIFYNIFLFNKYIWACSSKKGAYGFSNVMRANDVDDLYNYDVTIENVKHAAHMLQQMTLTFYFVKH